MVAAMAACLLASSPGLYYTVQVIGPADRLGPSALNNNGEVVGGTENGFGASRAFAWKDGRLRMLPMSSAADINDRGDIVGGRVIDGTRFVVLLTSEGKQLLIRKEGRRDIEPIAINENRWLTGWVDYPGRGIAPFVWKGGGEVIDIGYTSGPPTNNSQGLEINESNMIVGYERGPDYPFYGWVWTERDGLRRVFSLHFSYMTHVNDLGQWLTAPWRPRSVRGYSWGVYDRVDGEPLRNYPGFGLSKINNRGEILAINNNDQTGYWLLTRTESFRINDRIVPAGRWTNFNGKDINDRGQVLGAARDHDGSFYALLLTPVERAGGR